MDFSSYKKISDVLVTNFKAMFSARVEVPKKDFNTLLAGKPQKCRVRGPLTTLANNASTFIRSNKSDVTKLINKTEKYTTY